MCDANYELVVAHHPMWPIDAISVPLGKRPGRDLRRRPVEIGDGVRLVHHFMESVVGLTWND
jgi:hypothetical protein